MPSIEAIFNHLVLPPKLPGQQGKDIDDINYNVLARLKQACEKLSSLAECDLAKTLLSLHHTLDTCLEFSGARLEKASVLNGFNHLKPDGFLILPIFIHNAALLVRRAHRLVHQYQLF